MTEPVLQSFRVHSSDIEACHTWPERCRQGLSLSRAKSNIVKNFVVRNDEKVDRRVNATSCMSLLENMFVCSGVVGRDRIKDSFFMMCDPNAFATLTVPCSFEVSSHFPVTFVVTGRSCWLLCSAVWLCFLSVFWNVHCGWSIHDLLCSVLAFPLKFLKNMKSQQSWFRVFDLSHVLESFDMCLIFLQTFHFRLQRWSIRNILNIVMTTYEFCKNSQNMTLTDAHLTSQWFLFPDQEKYCISRTWLSMRIFLVLFE